MKYTSKAIQEILKSTTAIHGLDYITPIYQEAETALWLMEAMGIQGDLFVKWVQEMAEQILPQTATWSLEYWEEEYGLPVKPNISIEERRQRILLAVRTRAPMNPKRLEEILELAFSIEKVKILERTAKNTFSVELYGQLLEEQWAKVYTTIEKYKPAHLIIEASSIVETPFYHTLYIEGTVFSPVVETVLPEIEQYYDFVIPVNVACGCWNVMDTVLPEMEGLLS